MDPTQETNLQALKRRLCDDLGFIEYLKALEQRRLGLVLTGGGGKGAYEIGGVLALFDCGIAHFVTLARHCHANPSWPTRWGTCPIMVLKARGGRLVAPNEWTRLESI